MKVRLGLVLAVATLLAGTGCAGAPAASVAPAGPSLPGGEVLPEGIRPRDNTHTRAADLALAQAQMASDEASIEQRFRQALAAAEEGIAADPENPKSYYQAGIAYVGLSDYLGADSMLTRAEELHPRYILETEVWREQGWVDAYNEAIEPLNSGDLQRAMELFEQANVLYDRRPEALLQLGSLYSRVDRLEDAVAALQAAVDLLESSREVQLADTATASIWEQHWEIAVTSLGQVLTFSERYEEAAELFGALLREDPDDISLLGSLANVLSELGQADSVQALYDRLLARPDLGERDYFNAGVGLYQVEDYERAAHTFERAAEMNPFNRDALLNLCQTFSISSRFEELAPAARRLLEVDPRNGLGWIFLTRALSEMDRTEEANAVFLEYQSFGYEVEQLRLNPDPDGGAEISGEVKNVSLEPGTLITLLFRFGGERGQEAGTLEIQVRAPAEEENQFFRGTFRSDRIVTGYRYEVITP